MSKGASQEDEKRHLPLILVPDLSLPCAACNGKLKMQPRPAMVKVRNGTLEILAASYHATCERPDCKYKRYISFEELPATPTKDGPAEVQKPQVHYFPLQESARE